MARPSQHPSFIPEPLCWDAQCCKNPLRRPLALNVSNNWQPWKFIRWLGKLLDAFSTSPYGDNKLLQVRRGDNCVYSGMGNPFRHRDVGKPYVASSARNKEPTRRVLKPIASWGEWLASILLQHPKRLLCSDSFHQCGLAQASSLCSVWRFLASCQ